MDTRLLTQALVKFFLGVILVGGGLIFIPAWSLEYWQGWLLMGILFVPMFVVGLIMLVKNPDLLVLGAPISFLIMLGYIPVIAKRIKNEEKVLEEGLEGYTEYKKMVKYRVLPYIW